MFTIIGALGGFFLGVLLLVGEVAHLFLATLRWTFRALPEWRVLVKQGFFIGVQSLPVVLTTGAFTGMVLAYESFFKLNQLGVTSWVGPLLASSLVLQLGPVLAGVMMAGRVGGAMAAELGTMAVTEQVDALRTMGTDPVRYLVVPRVLAATFLTPLLTGFAIALGIFAGFSLCVHGLGANFHYMWIHTKSFLTPFDFFTGLTKAAAFGATMSLICCHKGITTRGGAEGVGKATTEANVASCIAILLLNLFLTMVLYEVEKAFS